MSYVQDYFLAGDSKKSKKWLITPYKTTTCLIYTLWFLYGLNKFWRYWWVDGVTFGQSQARCFPLASIFPKMSNFSFNFKFNFVC